MNRALSALIAIAATGALLAPLAATAKKNEANPNLSIKADPDVQVWPRQVTISGKLRGSDHEGKAIELEENPFPLTTGGFKTVGTTTTDAQGDYSFQVTPQEHTLYRASTTGVQPREVSVAITVRSRMKITRSVSDKTPLDNSTITFSGRVGPAHPGEHVLLQRRRPSGSWKTMTSTPLGPAQSDSTSIYSEEVQINRTGVWRARIKADEDHLGNKSRRVRIEVQ